MRRGAVRCGAIPFAALALKELCRHREQLWLSSEVLGEGGGVFTAAKLLLDRLVVDDGAAIALGWHVGVHACVCSIEEAKFCFLEPPSFWSCQGKGD